MNPPAKAAGTTYYVATTGNDANNGSSGSPFRTLQKGGRVPIGAEMELDGEVMIVSDAREASCIAAEGELPFTAPAGWTIFSVDFRSASGRCASLQRDGEQADFYDGRYVTLAELNPSNLRELEGWRLPSFAAA